MFQIDCMHNYLNIQMTRLN